MPLLNGQTQLKEVEVEINEFTPREIEAHIISIPKRVQHLMFLLGKLEDFEQLLVLVLNCDRQFVETSKS